MKQAKRLCGALILILVLSLPGGVYGWEEETWTAEGETWEEEYWDAEGDLPWEGEEPWEEPEGGEDIFFSPDLVEARIEETTEADYVPPRSHWDPLAGLTGMILWQHTEEPLCLYDGYYGFFEQEEGCFQFDEDKLREFLYLELFFDNGTVKAVSLMNYPDCALDYDCRNWAVGGENNTVTASLRGLESSLNMVLTDGGFPRPFPLFLSPGEELSFDAADAFLDFGGSWRQTVYLTAREAGEYAVLLEPPGLFDLTFLRLLDEAGGETDYSYADGVLRAFLEEGTYRLCIRGTSFGRSRIGFVRQQGGEAEDLESAEELALGEERSLSLIGGEGLPGESLPGEVLLRFTPERDGRYLLTSEGLSGLTLLQAEGKPLPGGDYDLTKDGYAVFPLEGGRTYGLRLRGEGEASVLLHELLGITAKYPGGLLYTRELEPAGGERYAVSEERIMENLLVYAKTEGGGSLLLKEGVCRLIYGDREWPLLRKMDFTADFRGLTADFSLLLVNPEVCQGEKALSLGGDWETVDGAGDRAALFSLSAPQSGYYTLHLMSPEPPQGDENDVLAECFAEDWEPKSCRSLPVWSITEDTPFLLVSLSEEETCHFTLHTSLAPLWVRAEREKPISALELRIKEGAPALVYGSPDQGDWQPDGFVFYPGFEEEILEAWTADEEGKLTKCAWEDGRLELVEGLSSCKSGDSSVTLRYTCLGREAEITVPVFSLADYAKGCPKAQLGEEVTLKGSGERPGLVSFTPEKSGTYALVSGEWSNTVGLLEADGRLLDWAFDNRQKLFSLTGGETYYLWPDDAGEVSLRVEEAPEVTDFLLVPKDRNFFFYGDPLVGYWDGDAYLLDIDYLTGQVLCEVTYADGTFLWAEPKELMADTQVYDEGEGIYEVEVSYRGWVDDIRLHLMPIAECYGYYGKEIWPEELSSWEWRSEADGRFIFTAPKEGTYWLSFGSAPGAAVEASVFDEEGECQVSFTVEGAQAEGNTPDALDLAEGETCYFDLYPLEGEETSIWVLISDRAKPQAALARPGKVKVKTGSRAVRVSWSEVQGAKFYRLYKKTGGGKYQLLAVTGVRTFTDRSVKSGEKYQYKVRAAGYETEAQTYTSSKARASKAFCFLSPCQKGKVSKKGKLTWKKVTGATGYELRCRKKGMEDLILQISGGDTQKKSLKGILKGTYTLWLRPVKKAGGEVYAGPWAKVGSYQAP